MKHFLEIGQLSCADVERLLKRANDFKKNKQFPKMNGLAMANLFYEPSTRTRVSFEMAGHNLGMHVVNLNLTQSSATKGEMIEDMIYNLHAMGISLFVIRHSQNGLPQAMVGTFCSGIHVINAGDGTHEHPTQALLDLMTILQQKPDLEKLKIVIVGDVLHSRVANSLQGLCALMGVGKLTLVAPEIWYPQTLPVHGSVTSSLQEGMQDADVVIALRIQKERLHADERMDLATYHAKYAITKTSLAWAKPDLMVMHPGPMNRGIEIDSDVADGKHSFILKQVKNGVFMRMAIIEALTSYYLS